MRIPKSMKTNAYGRFGEIRSRIATLEQEIATLQAELQNKQTELDRLIQERSDYETVFTDLEIPHPDDPPGPPDTPGPPGE
jgi:chromosome segregation ATPase